MWTELETLSKWKCCSVPTDRQLFANKLTKSDNITVLFIAFSFPLQVAKNCAYSFKLQMRRIWAGNQIFVLIYSFSNEQNVISL